MHGKDYNIDLGNMHMMFENLLFCPTMRDVAIFISDFKIAENKSLCTRDSTPPYYHRSGTVLVLGGVLVYKFKGKKFFIFRNLDYN